MELTQEQVLEQNVERAASGVITENSFQEEQDKPLFYHSTRNRGRCCLLCRHWTAPRDLRQERCYIVVFANGHCRLGETTCVDGRSLRSLQQKPHACRHSCPKFEKIPELKAKNMTGQQRRYAGMSRTKTHKCRVAHDSDCSEQ